VQAEIKLLRDIREVFKTLNHRATSKIYCPRCGSAEIHPSRNLDYAPNYGLASKKYTCEKCGYDGPIVMELEKEEG
jgi:predicted RNA-binding Zn-ribbon protein involved in translation (DUF1610 family)